MGERESHTPREPSRGAFVGKSEASLWHSAGGLGFARDSRRVLARTSRSARERPRTFLRRSSPFGRDPRDPFPNPVYSWGSLLHR